jgi:hypothetical protein
MTNIGLDVGSQVHKGVCVDGPGELEELGSNILQVAMGS